MEIELIIILIMSPLALFSCWGFYDMHKEFKKAKKIKILEYKSKLFPYVSVNGKKSLRCKFCLHKLEYKKDYKYCSICGDIFIHVEIPGMGSWFNVTRALRKNRNTPFIDMMLSTLVLWFVFSIMTMIIWEPVSSLTPKSTGYLFSALGLGAFLIVFLVWVVVDALKKHPPEVITDINNKKL